MKNKKDLLHLLEDTLVNEFRKLQTLIEASRAERKAITAGDVTALMLAVEKKETILDELGVLEASRRTVTGDLSTHYALPDSASFTELVTAIENPLHDRLHTLQEGITRLVEQARELNLGNHALASARSEWLSATQAFLLSFYPSPVGYTPSGAAPAAQTNPIFDRDHRA